MVEYAQSECGGSHTLVRAQDPGLRSEGIYKTNLRIAVIVPEMRKSVLLVCVKLRIRNERDGLDRALHVDQWVL